MGFDEAEREPTQRETEREEEGEGEGERDATRSKRVGGRSIGLVREGGYISQSGALCRASGVDVNSLLLSFSLSLSLYIHIYILLPLSLSLSLSLSFPHPPTLSLPMYTSFSSPFYLHPARH